MLNEKTAFVSRNRMRLIRDAERPADEANVRYAQAIQAAERARQEAVETRATLVWAHLFPSEALVSPAPTHLLAGAAPCNPSGSPRVGRRRGRKVEGQLDDLAQVARDIDMAGLVGIIVGSGAR